METVKGTIKQVVFKNEESGFKVLKIKINNGPILTITGEFGPEIVQGVESDFHGDYKTHPKYGTNFKVSSYNVSHNIEEIKSIQLFIESVSPNIGPERSSLIVNHFKNKTIDILENEPSRLIEVEGIGKKSAESLIKSWVENKEKWKEQRIEYSLRAFLNSLGIKEKKVKRILNFFGGGLGAEEKIRINPYLLTEIEGFGFSTTDFIARKLGVSEGSPERLKSFILYALNILCPMSGHLYLLLEEVITLINKYCSENNTYFINKRILYTDDIKLFACELVDLGSIIQDKDKLYGKLNYNSETKSAELLSSILNKPSDLIFLTREYIDKHIDNFERENKINLSKEQKDVLYSFVEKKVFVVTGAPGTGKTVSLKAVVSLIKHLKLNLTCVAPTGISAKKMASTIGCDAYTIHRRFGFKGNEWVYGEINKFETDIVLVDETSMVDQEVFYRLLSALKSRVHILFVGDDNQLPSVGAGNVLRELINCGSVPVVKLEQIFRQDEASDIIKAAHKIKQGDTDLQLFKPDPKADVFFLRENSIEKIEEIIIGLSQKFKDEKRSFQIITPRRNGPLSVETLNKTLQNVLNPGPDTECNLGRIVIRRGDRVMVIKNDYGLDIFNGEIGKIVNIGGGLISIQIDDKTVDISVDDVIDKIDLAYSSTIHKIQGQEYPYIILPFINQYGKNMLQRNLLYTAITRAKKKVIVIGHGSALERAINNGSVYKRNTKLGERIKCLQMKRENFSLPLLDQPVPSQIVQGQMEQSLPVVEECSPMVLIEE